MRKTTQDLGTELTDINDKLESLLMTVKKSPPVDIYHNESESIEKCRRIFFEALDWISEARLHPTITECNFNLEGDVDSISLRQLMLATADTLTILKECRKELSDIKIRLQGEKAPGRPFAGFETTGIASRRGASQLTSELNHTEQRPNTCSGTSRRASSELVHSFKDITVGKDSRQILISTSGEPLNAKRVTTGDRSLLLIGSCSNTTVQACVRDFREYINADSLFQ